MASALGFQCFSTMEAGFWHKTVLGFALNVECGMWNVE